MVSARSVNLFPRLLFKNEGVNQKIREALFFLLGKRKALRRKDILLGPLCSQKIALILLEGLLVNKNPGTKNLSKNRLNAWIGSKCGWTPFAGRKVMGWPVGTVVRGRLAMWEGELGQASGQPVRFGEALPKA